MIHTPDPELFERAINILVVGCGGNGSAIVGGLPYLHQALLAFGHPGGLNVTLLDPDTVSETNCVRQPFCRAETGLSKAIVLVHRTNMFWGFNWQGIQTRIEQLKSAIRSTSSSVALIRERQDARSTAGRCGHECCIGLISGTIHLTASSCSDSPTTQPIVGRSIAFKPWLSCIPKYCRPVRRRMRSRRAVRPKPSPARSRSSMRTWRISR